MCTYVEIEEKYTGCTASPKHVITKKKYDTDGCQKAKDSGYHCSDEATPVKGLNGQVIQFGSSKKPGPCPRCL